MIAQILPLIRLPRNLASFSYQIPAAMEGKVKIGQVVSVNFRKTKTAAVVVDISKVGRKIKFKLKEVEKILYDSPILNKRQFDLIKFVANYYGVAESIVAKSMVPEIPKNHKNIKALKHKSIKTLKQKNRNRKLLFWYKEEKEALECLKEKIKKRKGQILILVPEKIMINFLLEKLKLNDQAVIKNHALVAKKEFFKNWLAIMAGQPKVIIGTKISVFLPFSNLEEIIVFNEENENHKQSDINPRFDAREVAEWLAQAHNCNLTLMTSAPRVETYYKNVRTQRLKNKKINKIKIIDLKQEKLKGNYSFLSDELVEKIKQNLASNNRIFIFHNRKGLANYVFCDDCGYIFKCPVCQISLTYHLDDKKLSCHHCGYQVEMPPLCPNCQGPNIKFKGQGVEKIELELQKIFPEIEVLILEKSLKTLKYKNTRLSAPCSDNGGQVKTLKQRVGEFGVIIGTKFAINKIDFNDFSLIAFINFDQFLNQPDFRAEENAYQLFQQINSRVNQKTEFLIQTNQPENKVIQSLIKNRPELFYESELTLRKEFNYPPFSNLIKIISQHKIEKTAFAKLQKLSRELKTKFPTLEILGPLENYPKKIRGFYKYNLIIKARLDTKVENIIHLVPDELVVDVGTEKIN